MRGTAKLPTKAQTGERPDAVSALRTSLAALAADLSIEVTPKEALRGAAGLGELPPRTRTFITRLPKGSFEETLAAAMRLRACGLNPVPHFTARTTADATTLARRLDRMVVEAGVEEILLVAGSNDRPEGPFASTIDILKCGVIESSGLRALNVAGHPEGHPQANEAELHRALDAKNEFAARTGMPVALVTQFFFDAAPVIAWEERIRVLGNKLPIDPGLHGVTGMTSLMKHALACGVGASVKVLAQRSGNLLQFAQIHAPDAMLGELAAAKAADASSMFRNVHMFPLGGFERTVAWANSLRQGRISVTPEGRVTVAA
ncbi:methylenetetrahydrofolate reductase [Lichenihabitans psoromatis]|uniref:methylenetetrahydrofolate reductase n=1 Tax=Lichenihabitans psoromatis TaxID=2528642 RepID=UPI001035FC57|nr:methylenetetrahydrofolate reductase [Lichenihabitans psoromatis]